MTVAFCTYVSDKYYYSFGADRLVRSACYFYPLIPFYVFGDKEINEYSLPIESLHPFMINRIKKDYDLVIYFDADSMICGPLTELMELSASHDVVCVRNNNDFGMAGKDSALSQQNRDINIYVNAGLVAVRSQAFIDEWMDLNRRFAEMAPFGSQSVLNSIIDGYKWCIVDSIESGVHYGVSSLYGIDTHWDSWKHIRIEGDDLKLNDKCVRVLHHAGGFREDKMGLYLFNDQARQYLEHIIYPYKSPNKTEFDL